MKKLAILLGLVVALVAVTVGPSLAWADGGGRGHGWRGNPHRPFYRPVGSHSHTRVFIGVGPGFVYPYYYYPPPYYYYPPYVYTPPPVIVQEPPVYVQRPEAPPAPPAPPLQAEVYWYYCPSGKNYYPNVQACPEPWVKVPPRAP